MQETINDPAVVPEIVILEDGAMLNLATGEIVGYQDAPPLREEFTIVPAEEETLQATRDRETAQKALDLLVKEEATWAVERHAFANARKIGIEAEMNLLIAGIKERYETMVKEQEHKLSYLERTYGPVMEQYAKAELVGKKEKSIKLPYGTIGYRSSAGSTEVSDPKRAAFTLLQQTPKAVKVSIDLQALLTAQETTEDIILEGQIKTVLGAIWTSLSPKFIPEELTSDTTDKIAAVDVLPGISFDFRIKEMPVDLKGIEGVSRSAPTSALGKFYIDHGGKK